MLDTDTVIRSPHSRDDSRVSVELHDEGTTITLFFAEGDLSGEGTLLEVRIGPDAGRPFEPWVLVPRLPLYLRYARASVAWKHNDADAALRALRQTGATRRGLGDDFYRLAAQIHEALVAEGARHPVKALAQAQHVDISTASRWISEARRRGYLAEKTLA